MTVSDRSRWNQLRRRLCAATKNRGARSALARKFRVSTAAVAQWLSGQSAPTAETTLRLLEWVATAEAQQQHKKRAGRVEARPALKTRKAKSTTHEKDKSGPYKKP